MSTSTECCHDLDIVEPDSRDTAYSSDSSYSTYSREVKFIFNPVEDSTEEYGDYSHINPHTKQNCMSHTPHTHSGNISQVSGKENRIPYNSRNEHAFGPSPHVMSVRRDSVYSSSSRDRGPITPRMEEDLYSPMPYAYGPHKQNVPSDSIARDKTYCSPGSEIPLYPYARHSVQVWKNNNMPVPLHPQNVQNPPLSHQDMHNKHNRNNEPVLNTFQTQHPLTSVHNSSHYQQPSVHHPAGNELPYRQQQQNHGQASYEPPYPMPPRYNYQHHARRKTWSPPTLKMSLLNTSAQGSRVCYSNDSLDIAEEAGLERKTQSLSEDLDVTPPKLAPISGVLAQKPGPNLIRPIAFKPVQAGPSRSPAGHVTRRQPETGDHAHDPARPQILKLDTNVLGMQGSSYSQNGRSNVGAFSSMTKLQHLASGGGTHLPVSSQHAQESLSYPYSLTSHHSTSLNSCHNSSQHNSSISSHHNVSNNTYSNIPATAYVSTNSSPLSAGNEAGFSNPLLGTSEKPELVQPISALRVPSHAAEGALQTPSPSDSGVGELEAMLREKDAEINTLREVMDRNERAIFQVYEERRNTWFHGTQELQSDYERKLKVQSRKSYKTEQVLSLQVYKLQQEQKALQEEKAKIVSERDMLKHQAEEDQNQIAQLKLALEVAITSGGSSAINKSEDGDRFAESSIEEEGTSNKDSVSLQEELALKNKEVITLKSRLHSFQADMDKKNRELTEKVREVSVKTEEMKLLKDELIRLRDPPVLAHISTQTHAGGEVTTSENMKPSMLGERDRIISGLQEELMETQAQIVLLKDEHEKEREKWLDEKNRVVRYQKQLQLNYVQIQRKNATLEAEVQQLMLELENRDMKLVALAGEESVC